MSSTDREVVRDTILNLPKQITNKFEVMEGRITDIGKTLEDILRRAGGEVRLQRDFVS